MPRPLSRPPHRAAARALAAAVVLVLVLVGCGGDEDVSAEQFQEDLLERVNPSDDDAEQVMPESVAACFTEKIYDEFDQQEINRIYHAADEDELGNATRDTLNQFNQECFTAYLESVQDGGGEDVPAEGDTATTEAADDEGSSTTEADTATTEG